ncbi:hypothetical protein [Pseudoalteromonas maricaloris]|uniref:hypothetical protein n=1 Tax=Pseudoalteromonas maricaloris TaxID=184924 RepID=UPI003C27285C
MKKVNFLGLIQHFLFSKSLFNKGSTKSIHCDSVDSFGIYNPPRKQPVKTANFASNLLAKGELATVGGGNSAVKPPREKTNNRNTSQLSTDICSSVTGGGTAKKPPRGQYFETKSKNITEGNLNQLPQNICYLVSGGATAYKPPRVQSEKDSQG